MKQSNILYVGLDGHKDRIDIAVAAPGRDGGVRHIGTIGGDLVALDRAVRKLVSGGRQLRIVHKAGTCGFVICRYLAAKEFTVSVVAPSSIARNLMAYLGSRSNRAAAANRPKVTQSRSCQRNHLDETT